VETTRLHFVYDAWNRLVEVKADSGGQPGAAIATYQYDGRGFRTRKVLAGGGTFDYYYNEAHQVVEVRGNGDADAYEQYVWDARYIDAPVMIYRDTNTDGVVDQNLYVMQDANFNTTATLNGATGAVQNRFTYTPYGRRTVLNSAWAAATTDVTLGHQGLSLDAETGLYYNRARMLHPTLGTFTGRDPLGYVDGGSLYEYVQCSPIYRADPSGNLTVHIWRFQARPGAWGHAAITLEDGTYISWWPSDDRHHIVGNIYWAPALLEPYEKTVEMEGQFPDDQIKLTCLNEAKIKAWWDRFKTSHVWATLTMNCSTVARRALMVGGAPGLPMLFGVNPTTVRTMALDMEKCCQRRASTTSPSN
jgi:RHS repeat-associated protein